jgi:hypothetical protein
VIKGLGNEGTRGSASLIYGVGGMTWRWAWPNAGSEGRQRGSGLAPGLLLGSGHAVSARVPWVRPRHGLLLRAMPA